MSSEGIEREFEAFDEALRVPANERASFLGKRYPEDPDFVTRMLRLLASQEELGSSDDGGGVSWSAPEDRLPEAIGHYRILERLGEGGMGIVYAAEQRVPLQRRVALKVIKPGMDSREVLQRFEVERQTMALLAHPGIAKALDAGVTEGGQPYFVMELVQGLPLVEYCERNELSLQERLQIFVRICSAIQHAHHRGVIHRDLKPSNILVTRVDGAATPKVIDFGIAKATTGQLAAGTLFTNQGRVMGTPQYMSPEQAELSGGDVDTRSDIYSLGVILYELVTGAPAYSASDFQSKGYLEILRQIIEVDPPRPSSRLRNRIRTEGAQDAYPGAHHRALRGDLDWIVMRAIEKNPQRRYATASALSDDVERHLSMRPVLAAPPSGAYALRKFVRRHRIAAALLALFVISLFAGIIGLGIGLHQAREARELAGKKAEQAEASAAVLQRLLFRSDPENGGGSPTLLEVMGESRELVERELQAFPEVEASVSEALGVALRRRSRYTAARPYLLRSLALRRQHLGDQALETVRSMVAVANLLSEHEGSIARPLDLLDEALAALQLHGRTDTLYEAWIQLDVGLLHLAGDGLVEAEVAFQRSLDLMERELGPRHPNCGRPLRGLALVALGRNDLARAEELGRRAIDLSVGPQERYIRTRALMAFVRICLSRGRVEEASDLMDRVVPNLAASVGPQHIRIVEHWILLAQLHFQSEEFASAQTAAEEALEGGRAILAEGHPMMLEARLWRQRAKLGVGDMKGQQAELSAIERTASALLGHSHPLVIQSARTRLEFVTLSGDGRGRQALEQRLPQMQAHRERRIQPR